MKRFFVCLLIFLQVILLPACQTESLSSTPVGSDSITTAAHAAATAAVTESSTEPVTGDTLLSPVRYTIDYEITDIYDKYPEIKTTTPVFYTKDEQLYINALTYQNQEYQFRLIVLDTHGVPTEYPLPPFTENRIIPRYVYPLENGKFVLIYSPMNRNPAIDSTQSSERYLTIANEDGSFEKSVYISNFYTAEAYAQVFEDRSVYNEHYVELYIFVQQNGSDLVCYNRYLEETVVESTDEIIVHKYLGNYRFLSGIHPWDLFTFGLYDEKINAYPMHIPTNWDNASVYTDSQKNLYLLNDSGIYQYRGNDQPIKILDMLESGLNFSNYWYLQIINKEAVYTYRADTQQLLLYQMRKVPDTDTRATLRIDIMGLSDSVLSWLLDGVTQFNNQNSVYKVKLNAISDIGGVDLREYYRDVIDEMLLYGSHPDMVMTDHVSVLASYYEKGAFLDMNSRINQRLLGCARGIDGDDSTLYQIPFGMQLTTFAVPSANAPQKLTYDAFLSQMEQLQGGQYLTAFVPMTFYDIYADFIDYDAKTSRFNSEEFREVFLAMHTLQTEHERYMNKFAGELSFGVNLINTGVGDSLADYARYGNENEYWTLNGTVGTALDSGDLKYLSVAFNDMRAFPALKLIFGDTEFSLCGYPSMSGGGASITSTLSAAVLWDTEYADGCAAFLNFLLSDSMQNKLAASDIGLPVTYSAMSSTIDQHRYSIYDKMTADAMYKRNTPGYVSLKPQEISAVRLPEFDSMTQEEQQRRIVEITDEDKQMLLDFFEDVRPRRQTESVLQSIITEEISYWENNARSLEETTKIIDSRVWIYLNE